MFAYRFLARGGLGAVNQFKWPLPEGSTPGAWVGPQADTTTLGVYAQRLSDLPYWVHDELYRVELRGTVHALSLGVLASEMRFVERVDGWNESLRRDFGKSCVERLRQCAAATHDEHGEPLIARCLMECDVGEIPQVLAATDMTRHEAVGNLLVQYLIDAVNVQNAGLTASVAHVARVAISECPQLAGKHHEELAQSQWLQHRLGLPSDTWQ